MGRFVWLPIKSLKSNGCTENEISIAENIPIIETMEIEYSAGCFAKTKTPTPKIVVKTESIMEVLCVAITFSPVRNSFSKPLVIKML